MTMIDAYHALLRERCFTVRPLVFLLMVSVFVTLCDTFYTCKLLSQRAGAVSFFYAYLTLSLTFFRFNSIVKRPVLSFCLLWLPLLTFLVWTTVVATNWL
jgi:hypothetical protein